MPKSGHSCVCQAEESINLTPTLHRKSPARGRPAIQPSALHGDHPELFIHSPHTSRSPGFAGLVVGVFFCLPLVWIQTVHAGCPTGWKMSANNCILIRDVSLSWAAAQRNCKNDNSDLASFSDPVDELFLLKALSANSPHWVGYQSSPSDPGWLDGTSEATNTRFTASSMTSGLDMS
ncbi:hypothetical protein C0Q70_09948 [Pomacea canaliculata]|uniref:C-type lectin domain-containing protein n=1 Tax=Pomacea canaliculata TaxID=400727 RepID=A0A2T7PB72_POMCA|nr:hypothetical protein C0Q70_09948 [Pomacea canaliculata]